jgi:hypothetical protein
MAIDKRQKKDHQTDHKRRCRIAAISSLGLGGY